MPESAPDVNAAFDPAAALAKVQAKRAVARRRRTWGNSRLTPFRAELVKMRSVGGSFADLAVWLRTEKRVKVDESTVRRYLQKLPEVTEQPKA
jgi:hypothetical protein